LIGANVEGKKVRPIFWFGGTNNYILACEKEAADGYPNFVFTPNSVPAV
jgi:hypothetical protein